MEGRKILMTLRVEAVPSACEILIQRLKMRNKQEPDLLLSSKMSSLRNLHLYRSLVRELRLASKKSRNTRNTIVQQHMRLLVSSQSPEAASRTMLETRDFLRASRMHTELLRRYNPLHDMTDEEKIKATARRVGLNTPVEYDKE